MAPPPRPGQPPWPERGGYGDTAPIRPGGPERPAPIQFRPQPPPRTSNQALTWVLRSLGLLAVAVISGLAWWYINDEGPAPRGASGPTAQQRDGQFDYSQVGEIRRDSNCADHAYRQVKEFFQQTPCQQLTRALYTTTAEDGRKVYTNVSVVRMADASQAAALRGLADKDNTGNVSDLIREGVVKLPPLRSLSDGGGYSAVQHDRNVIIVESDFDPAATKTDKAKDEAVLDAICVDATLLGDDIGT